MKYKDIGKFERGILLNIAGFMLEHKADYINQRHILLAMKVSARKTRVLAAVDQLNEKRLNKALDKLVVKGYIVVKRNCLNTNDLNETFYGLIPGRLI